MRGNLIWNGLYAAGTHLEFKSDMNGDFEIVPNEKGIGGKIILYQKRKVADFVWTDDKVIDFVTTMKHKNCSVADLDEYKRGEKGWGAWKEGNMKMEDKLFDPPQAKQEINSDKVACDYEITAFRHKDHHEQIAMLQDDGYYYSLMDLGCDLQHHLDAPYSEIFSVKRKSDSQVFNVDEITEQGKIKRFTILETGLGVAVDMNKTARNYFLAGLTKKKEEKQALFTTLDGKIIYEGESYFSVSDDFQLLRTDLAKEKDGSWKRSFGTKEEAEQYIFRNKPLLSLQEIFNLASNTTVCSSPDWTLLRQSQLIDLAKQKSK